MRSDAGRSCFEQFENVSAEDGGEPGRGRVGGDRCNNRVLLRDADFATLRTIARWTRMRALFGASPTDMNMDGKYYWIDWWWGRRRSMLGRQCRLAFTVWNAQR